MDVLIVSSPGGHSVQASLIEEVFSTINYLDIYHIVADDKVGDLYLNDCNFKTPISSIMCLVRSLFVYSKLQPRIVISTGAAPGCLFLMIAKLFGSYCIWVDSVANISKLSLSGRVAKLFCNKTYTQWEHLATRRVEFSGTVI